MNLLKDESTAATSQIDVSERKKKSLKFRMRRRELKLRHCGNPFSKREGQKNSNRQSAALARKRDGNGKFLNIPIYPKKVETRQEKVCQIFA